METIVSMVEALEERDVLPGRPPPIQASTDRLGRKADGREGKTQAEAAAGWQLIDKPLAEEDDGWLALAPPEVA